MTMTLNSFVLTQQRAVQSMHEQCNNLKQQRRLLQMQVMTLEQETMGMKQLGKSVLCIQILMLTISQFSKFPELRNKWPTNIGFLFLEITSSVLSRAYILVHELLPSGVIAKMQSRARR
jgi:hypothetical protein